MKKYILKIKLFFRKHRLVITLLLLLTPFVLAVSFVQILDRTKKKRTRPVEYLVVHYTANFNTGADARANAYYLQKTRRAGTHYCIDDEEIVQCTKEDYIAYAVGDRTWRGFKPKFWLNGKIKNGNSLSFEMCLGGDRDDAKIVETTAQMIGWQLVNKGLDISRVVRHHDVSGKHCPKFLYTSEWNQIREDSAFNAFKDRCKYWQNFHLQKKQKSNDQIQFN